MLSKFTLVDLSMSVLSSECPKLGKMCIGIRNKQKTTGSYSQAYLGKLIFHCGAVRGPTLYMQ